MMLPLEFVLLCILLDEALNVEHLLSYRAVR
jgi:hypothetical protein